MTEQQRRAWDELRRAAIFYEDEYWRDPASNPLLLAIGYLEAAGGARELATARLLRALDEILAVAYRDDDDGPDDDDDEPPPLPPEILKIFDFEPAL
jgi:hypothetical protein